MIARVLDAPQDQLLSVGQTGITQVTRRAHSFDGLICESCGEMVIEGYARIAGGKTVCIPCRERLTGA